MRNTTVRQGLVLLLVACASKGVFSQARTTAECIEEQGAMARAIAAISAYQLGAAPFPPGVELSGLKLGDPDYQGPHWRKYSMEEIHKRSEKTPPLGQVLVRRKKVEIHFMVNLATKRVQQVKFKNTVETGCVGKLEPAPSRGRGGGRPEITATPPAPRRGEVTVGPVKPAEHPPLHGATNCAVCHSGTGSGALERQRLKTPPHRFNLASNEPEQSPVDEDAELPALDETVHRRIARAEPAQRGRLIDSLL